MLLHYFHIMFFSHNSIYFMVPNILLPLPCFTEGIVSPANKHPSFSSKCDNGHHVQTVSLWFHSCLQKRSSLSLMASSSLIGISAHAGTQPISLWLTTLIPASLGQNPFIFGMQNVCPARKIRCLDLLMMFLLGCNHLNGNMEAFDEWIIRIT